MAWLRCGSGDGLEDIHYFYTLIVTKTNPAEAKLYVTYNNNGNYNTTTYNLQYQTVNYNDGNIKITFAGYDWILEYLKDGYQFSESKPAGTRLTMDFRSYNCIGNVMFK